MLFGSGFKVSKNLNAKGAENPQRTAEALSVEFLCGTQRKTSLFSAVKTIIFY